MNQIDFILLRRHYRTRLDNSTVDNYLSVLNEIFQDIERKVKLGELTKEQGEELVRTLLNIALESYRIDGFESLSESLEKGAYEISFDANDSLANIVASLKVQKK
ncbi:hypothetical protein ACK323_20540 [Aeromonas enteropelogenes]|uniref:hypothetical protein n=1 Tax=Aeromonas TaxID=642 RepID=UPI0015E75021|nr:hypothetical protein [Aeromonas veronii]MBA2084030.1 hypothetical protein [Aeromonas veronii]